ncbi:MAG TPA: AsmA-like C-terminal region-containing protein [Lacipirellulaceae bacterium]|nr:AsmA-like C-terminal region-containing protein [Lacipirellulaceae bacterium]
MVNFCWSLLKWCLLLTVVSALAVGGYLYFKLDDEIRRQVEMRFANHYGNFNVSIGSARFDAERGIAIDNLCLTPKTIDGSTAAPILSIDEMYLAGNLRIEQLVTNQLQIADVVIRHAKLRMVRDADGQWNSAALFPLPHFSDQSPKITIEDASATVACSAEAESKPWTLQGVNLKLSPLPLAGGQPSTATHYHIEGSASCLPARDLSITGQLGGGDGLLDIAVVANGLDISPALCANLPAAATTRIGTAGISGQANVTLHLNRANSTAPLNWSTEFLVDRGRLDHESLPEALTDVSLEGFANPQQIVIKRMTAKCGSASVTMAMNRAGWAPGAPLAISAKVNGFQLSERLQMKLPESQARIWQRFRPIGAVDADVRLTFDGTQWKPVITATCHSISITDTEKFPYLVEQTSGQVTYHPAENGKADELHLDLTGVGGGRPIKIVAELKHLVADDARGPAMGEGVADDEVPPPVGSHAAGYRGIHYVRGTASGPSHPLGYVEVSGDDIPLHTQLIDALPAKAKELVQSLQGQGTIDFRFRAEWKDLAQRQAEVTQDIRLKDCRVRFAHFPLPLQHVQGLVTERNSQWMLNDIEARGNNDSTIVKCRGGVVPHDSGCEADITVEATKVPLDENFQAALAPGRPQALQAWEELRPRGSIDFTAHVTRQPNDLDPNVEIALRPCGHTVSIEPKRFAYRLEDLDGVVTYKHGQVEWQKVSAHHDRSTYSIGSGVWQVAADGGWQCNLANVNVDRLSISRDLQAALPPAAQAVVDKLQPSGTIDLSKGSFSFVKPAQSQVVAATWDVNLECQQAAIQGAVPLQGITGGIHLVGRTDGRAAYSAGDLALDSVLCKEVQLTNVRGPFWADATHCLIGEPACQQQNQPLKRLIADVYGGTVSTNVELVHDTSPSYKIDMRIGGANLARFANERLGSAKDMNGTVSGTLAVSGTGTSTQTLRGGGELHVVDANIYELPVLVAMLKLLSNRPPDTTAFNRCDMKFNINGEHVEFEHLNLTGDAMSLYGQGEGDLNRKLDLTFYTLIGPADLPIPILKTMWGHVSQQGFQLKVVGTLDDPKVKKEPFPAVAERLSQLQSEFQQGPANITPSTATHDRRPAAR